MARIKERGGAERGGEGSNACVPGKVVEGYLSVFNISAYCSSVINAIFFLFENPPPSSLHPIFQRYGNIKFKYIGFNEL